LGCPIRNVIRIMHSLLKVSATPHPSVAFFWAGVGSRVSTQE
jgi:hypothetical protein